MSYHADPRCPRTCAYCGKPVKRTDGFFRSYPVPTTLHHTCVRPYQEAR